MDSTKRDQLLEELLKIPGDKIITLSLKKEVLRISIGKTGQMGSDFLEKKQFLKGMQKAIHFGGGMIIREFLPLKVKRMTPNETEMWIPEKNLYGVCLGRGKWVGLSVEDLQECQETDPRTGGWIPKEEGIHYQPFPYTV